MNDDERKELLRLLNHFGSAVRVHAVGPCALDDSREREIEQARHEIVQFCEELVDV